MIHFSSDENNSAYNLRVHGIAFPDAIPVFYDPYRLTEEDSVVDGEQRWRSHWDGLWYCNIVGHPSRGGFRR